MSHELVIIDGVASMAYTGEKPWHGLGQELTPDADIDTWKEQAGMNWNIKGSSISFKTKDADGKIAQKTYDGNQVLYRSDTLEQLSIVSKSYKIVQPGEILEFFQDLVGGAGMKLSTAGCLFGGRRFWALAETGKFGHLVGNDAIKGNLLLTTSCDGTAATTASFVATRVVCNNTLRIALQEDTKRTRVHHSREFKPQELKQSLGLIDDAWTSFMTNVNRMAETAIKEEKARDFVYDLVAKKGLSVEDQPYTTKQIIDSIMDKFHHGMGNGGETVWHLVNGITEHYQHEMGRTKLVDTKLYNNFFGSDAKIKDEAFEKALGLL